jgi:hypothetical protein
MIELNSKTEPIVRRIIWFEDPQKALTNLPRFLAYAMRYALPEDMAVIRQYIDDETFRTALKNVPPGIVDGRSWAYWNARLGLKPALPLPDRASVLT